MGAIGTPHLTFVNQMETRWGLMNQDRYDVQGLLNEPTSWLESVKLRGAYNDYDHTEFEAPGVPGTVFNNKQSQVRVEAVHDAIDGWRGAFGVQYDHRKFSATGEEAFLPQSITEGLGAFLIEERPYSLGTLELGVRVQRDESDPTQGFHADQLRGRFDLRPG
jgi:iron complex outermembrane receptor protein